MSIKRLSVPLDENQHRAIKLAAMLNGQTIKEYILNKLFSAKTIPNDKTLQAMRDIEENKNLTAYTADEFLKELNIINEQTKR